MPQKNKHSAKTTEPGPGKRCLRQGTAENGYYEGPNSMDVVTKPLTDEERTFWKGWVELESDPVSIPSVLKNPFHRESPGCGIRCDSAETRQTIFSYILQEYGVKNVKVQEVLSLDDEMLTFLLKPVYGLVFLFAYRDEENEQEDWNAMYPKGVWFANQTINNACATVALLNIVMNVPSIDIGVSLERFKADYKNFKPAYKGQMLGNNDFLRGIHNSFVRRMDILNADLALANEAEKAKKPAMAKGATRRKKAMHGPMKDEEELGYHFIAYVPINGEVWKLDGLQRQPINLGRCGDDWLSVARSNIHHRIQQYEEDGVQFSLLSLCQSPLRAIQENLAENEQLIRAIEEKLLVRVPDWEQYTQPNKCPSFLDNLSLFDLSRQVVETASISEALQNQLSKACENPGKLLMLYQSACDEQARLQSSYLEEVAVHKEENKEAIRRRHDYSPKIYNSLKSLAQHGLLNSVLDDIKHGGSQDLAG